MSRPDGISAGEVAAMAELVLRAAGTSLHRMDDVHREDVLESMRLILDAAHHGGTALTPPLAPPLAHADHPKKERRSCH